MIYYLNNFATLVLTVDLLHRYFPEYSNIIICYIFNQFIYYCSYLEVQYKKILSQNDYYYDCENKNKSEYKYNKYEYDYNTSEFIASNDNNETSYENNENKNHNRF